MKIDKIFMMSFGLHLPFYTTSTACYIYHLYHSQKRGHQFDDSGIPLLLDPQTSRPRVYTSLAKSMKLLRNLKNSSALKTMKLKRKRY
jgi:hypothetical protein